MCPDGKETVCKRGATGADGEGLSCVAKRCVCKENSCYIAQTGQCVQDGCHVPVAQVAAIQAVGGIGSPNAQAAAIRAGHQMEEQSVLQQQWMPPKQKESEAVRFFWSDELIEKAKTFPKEAEGKALHAELEKSEPVEGKPLTKPQVEELEKLLGKKLSDIDLQKEFAYKSEAKVAYFWTQKAKDWVEAEKTKNKVVVDMFNGKTDKGHMEIGEPVSARQLVELGKLGGAKKEGASVTPYDWRKESAGAFEEEEKVKATYRWRQAGIKLFKGEDWKEVYKEVVGFLGGPLRGNAIVPELAVKAFEDKYGTMARANKDGALFDIVSEAPKVALDDDSNNTAGLSDVKATIVPQVAMPRFENGLPVIIGQGSKTTNTDLQGLAGTMRRLSEKLENLADHRIDVKEPEAEEEEMAIQSPAVIVASFAPCLPRSACSVGHRREDISTSTAGLRDRWSKFFPHVSIAAQ